MRQTTDRLQKRMTTLATCRSTAGAAVLLLGISACSGGDGAQEVATLPASQVCASTLDSSAAAALERIGGTAKFTELPGTDDSGKPNKFSLKHAASTIHEDQTLRNQCVVFKAGDKTGHPLISVDFSADNHVPSKHTSAASDESGQAFYSLGAYAKTNRSISALLYFECSTKNSQKSTSHIRASLTSAPGQVAAKATGQDLMTVLNAVSRGMAQQLGCASEAALPSRVPEAEAQ
ncbi:hypothetical protein [Streptomyces sp. NPDC001348]